MGVVVASLVLVASRAYATTTGETTIPKTMSEAKRFIFELYNVAVRWVQLLVHIEKTKQRNRTVYGDNRTVSEWCRMVSGTVFLSAPFFPMPPSGNNVSYSEIPLLLRYATISRDVSISNVSSCLSVKV